MEKVIFFQKKLNSNKKIRILEKKAETKGRIVEEVSIQFPYKMKSFTLQSIKERGKQEQPHEFLPISLNI